MKLTKAQIKKLKDKEWDVVSDGEENTKILKIYPEDGAIFGEVCEMFRLTGDEEYEGVNLAVVATKEE